MLKVSVCVLFLIFHTIVAVEYIPALIWETGSSESWKSSSAFQKMPVETFKDLVSSQCAHKELILILAEENLSVEDFSWRDVDGVGSFTKLDNLTSGEAHESAHFLADVESPMDALLGLEQQWQEVSAAELNTLLSATKEQKLRVLVHLDDAMDTEDRPDMLHRHDSIVADAILAAMEVYDKIFVIYTGYHSSWVPAEINLRRIRSLSGIEETAVNNNTFINAEDKAFFYSSNLTFKINNNVGVELTNFKEATVEEGEEGEEAMKLLIVYDQDSTNYTILLPFLELSAGYWSIPTLTVFVDSEPYVMNTTEDITAPERFSYHCSQEIVYTSTALNASLFIKDLQVQPRPPIIENQEERRFSDAYDCVWFFTVPIWSGLAVTILFLIILSSGLTMITDIKTMDRFDDPKGKTITINATD